MEKIQAIMILEILGKPADYVLGSLNELVGKLGEEKGVKILNKQLHEPLPVKESKELFTTFAELEIEFDTIEMYLAVLFAYMPAHVEVVRPDNLALSAAYFNDLGNKIIQRMHNYDAITKKTLYENQILLDKLRQFAPAVFRQLTTPPQVAKPIITEVKKQEVPVKKEETKKESVKKGKSGKKKK